MVLLLHPLYTIVLASLVLVVIPVSASVLSSYSLRDLHIDQRASSLPPVAGLKLLLKKHFLYSSDVSVLDDAESTSLANIKAGLMADDKYFRLLSPQQMECEMERLDGLDYRFGFSIARRFLDTIFAPVVAILSAAVVMAFCGMPASIAMQYSFGSVLMVAVALLSMNYRQLCPIMISEVDSSCVPHLAVGDRVVAVDGIGATRLSTKDIQRRLREQALVELTLLRPGREGPNTGTSPTIVPEPGRKERSLLQKWVNTLSSCLGLNGTQPAAAAISAATETGRAIYRDGSVLVNVTVAKQLVSAPGTVDHALLPSASGELTVGYIRIRDFNDQTYPTFASALSQLRGLAHTQRNGSLDALVCDLRGNGGGCLVPALDVAATFLPRGACLTQLRARHHTHAPRSTNSRPDLHTALLFLVDGNMASASEILVQALCDGRNGRRAASLGQPTRGKNYAQVSSALHITLYPPYFSPSHNCGPTQAVVRLSDGSGVCFSVYEFLTPSGRSMQGGHQPTIVHCPADSLRPDRLRYDSVTRTWSLRPTE